MIHSVATLLRHYFKWLQHCSNIATLCYAKKRRCESSHVTSPQGDVHETICNAIFSATQRCNIVSNIYLAECFKTYLKTGENIRTGTWR